ncbi:DUF1178 family protein [Falsirhodobacter sp. alg1]|uniref:DUF1178 family protein n=1 Tax=Falsirhodobacter sp. alg1 TaxID=1472418 RepID=UPI000787EE74|nr:DUF1178 family protein [Falsirhodobacter sp. alg1]
MIRFTLRCSDGHSFESWFASGDTFETLRKAGHVPCPECGNPDVEKALMAPAVSITKKTEALAALKKMVEANSEYVGTGFVGEARKMHAGDAPKRSIHGEARLDEARKLIEEGVPVLPLPFIPKRQTN